MKKSRREYSLPKLYSLQDSHAHGKACYHYHQQNCRKIIYHFLLLFHSSLFIHHPAGFSAACKKHLYAKHNQEHRSETDHLVRVKERKEKSYQKQDTRQHQCDACRNGSHPVDINRLSAHLCFPLPVRVLRCCTLISGFLFSVLYGFFPVQFFLLSTDHVHT